MVSTCLSILRNVFHPFFWLLKNNNEEHEQSELDEELENEKSSDIPIYSSDPHTISFLRFCSKCFAREGDEKNGCYGAFLTYCNSKDENLHFVDFRGNRFNVIFLMDQIAFFHHENIRHFFFF